MLAWLPACQGEINKVRTLSASAPKLSFNTDFGMQNLDQIERSALVTVVSVASDGGAQQPWDPDTKGKGTKTVEDNVPEEDEAGLEEDTDESEWETSDEEEGEEEDEEKEEEEGKEEEKEEEEEESDCFNAAEPLAPPQKK